MPSATRAAGVYSTRSPRNWRTLDEGDARANVGPSSSSSTTRHGPSMAGFCVPSTAATPCTEKLVAVRPGGGRGKTRACDRVRRRLVSARARAHPTRPTTTRPPNSDPISSAPRHTYRAGRSTTTVQHHTVRQCVCRRVLREVRVFYRSASGNNIFLFFLN